MFFAAEAPPVPRKYYPCGLPTPGGTPASDPEGAYLAAMKVNKATVTEGCFL